MDGGRDHEWREKEVGASLGWLVGYKASVAHLVVNVHLGRPEGEY